MTQTDEDLLEKKFDFDEFVREAKLGYAETVARKRSLQEQFKQITADLASVEEAEKKLGAMLQSMGIEPEESLEFPRQSHIAETVFEVVSALFSDSSVMRVAEEKIVNGVREKLPNAKSKSIQAALYRLIQKRKLDRTGKRGAYEYLLLADDDLLNPPPTPNPPTAPDNPAAPPLDG